MTRIQSFLTLALILAVSVCSASVEIEVVLKPEHTGTAIPVSAGLPDGLDLSSASKWHLADKPTGSAVPCQLGADGERLWFVIESPACDTPVTKRFRLAVGSLGDETRMRVLHTRDKRLAVVDGRHQVLIYNYRNVLPEGVPASMRRSSYIHPIYGLDGELLTDDFPKDHYHHRGLSWMWTHVRVDGEDHDLWGIRGVRQRFEKVLDMESGPVYARLKLANGWYTDDGRKIVVETVDTVVYPAGETGRLIEVNLTFEAQDRPVTIDSSERGYGGLNLRFSPRRDTTIVTPDGRIAQDVDRVRFPWADLSARFGDASVFSGVTIFDLPGNPSHPTGWTLRPYGILNPSFTGVKPVILEPGKLLHVRYLLWVHRGDAASGKVEQVYRAMVDPPQVVLRSDR